MSTLKITFNPHSIGNEFIRHATCKALDHMGYNYVVDTSQHTYVCVSEYETYLNYWTGNTVITVQDCDVPCFLKARQNLAIHLYGQREEYRDLSNFLDSRVRLEVFNE